MDNPIPCQPGLKPSADASLLNASWPLHLREDRALWTLAARFLHDLVLLTFCLKDLLLLFSFSLALCLVGFSC